MHLEMAERFDYYDVCWPKTVNGKTFWSKLGVAFPGKDGRINLKLELFPTGFQDRAGEDIQIILFPKQKGERNRYSREEPERPTDGERYQPRRSGSIGDDIGEDPDDPDGLPF